LLRTDGVECLSHIFGDDVKAVEDMQRVGAVSAPHGVEKEDEKPPQENELDQFHGAESSGGEPSTIPLILGISSRIGTKSLERKPVDHAGSRGRDKRWAAHDLCVDTLVLGDH
jgi:hypothetical protein